MTVIPITDIKVQTTQTASALVYNPPFQIQPWQNPMILNAFLNKLNQTPEAIEFSDTMSVIEANYHFTPTQFSNGNTINQADQNNGSCKIFAFGQLNNLTEQQTLACFGTYYRDDVLKTPEGNDHQNIRNFIVSGWPSISFKGQALTVK